MGGNKVAAGRGGRDLGAPRRARALPRKPRGAEASPPPAVATCALRPAAPPPASGAAPPRPTRDAGRGSPPPWGRWRGGPGPPPPRPAGSSGVGCLCFVFFLDSLFWLPRPQFSPWAACRALSVSVEIQRAAVGPGSGRYSRAKVSRGLVRPPPAPTRPWTTKGHGCRAGARRLRGHLPGTSPGAIPRERRNEAPDATNGGKKVKYLSILKILTLACRN